MAACAAAGEPVVVEAITDVVGLGARSGAEGNGRVAGEAARARANRITLERCGSALRPVGWQRRPAGAALPRFLRVIRARLEVRAARIVAWQRRLHDPIHSMVATVGLEPTTSEV